MYANDTARRVRWLNWSQPRPEPVPTGAAPLPVLLLWPFFAGVAWLLGAHEPVAAATIGLVLALVNDAWMRGAWPPHHEAR